MKLVLGLPWYIGPDDNTFPLYFDHMMYYGAFRERSIWRELLGPDKFSSFNGKIPPLSEGQDSPENEPTEEDWSRLGRLSIMICNYSRTSLVGKAREMIVDLSLEWDADYLFWWDADMRFEHSSFLRLWRNQVPVCGALAFTARPPFHPVIFRIRERYDPINQALLVEGSDVAFDYPRNQLIGNEHVHGELAIGGGVTLYDMRIFKEIPKPWFTSTGCGEDWFFSHRCKEYRIPRFVDARVHTQHKAHAPHWVGEEAYLKYRENNRDEYVELFGSGIQEMKDGKVVPTILGEPGAISL